MVSRDCFSPRVFADDMHLIRRFASCEVCIKFANCEVVNRTCRTCATGGGAPEEPNHTTTKFANCEVDALSRLHDLAYGGDSSILLSVQSLHFQ
jgi:hypothetical protein